MDDEEMVYRDFGRGPFHEFDLYDNMNSEIFSLQFTVQAHLGSVGDEPRVVGEVALQGEGIFFHHPGAMLPYPDVLEVTVNAFAERLRQVLTIEP